MSMEIHQITFTEPASAHIGMDDPKFKAYSRLSFQGSKVWNEDEQLKFFGHVATVDTDDLDEAFELMNLWNDESRVTRHARLHSLSVGDIIIKEDGSRYMVEPFGFKLI